MLAPLAHENLPFVGEQPNDMLVGSQPFLHRHIDMIAATGASRAAPLTTPLMRALRWVITFGGLATSMREPAEAEDAR